MGFVGFKSHDAAQEAVKYFNKTFLKMSKISVDIARPVRQVFVSGKYFPSCLFFPSSSPPHADQLSWSGD
jgi:RNA recognition motif-containing protein